MLVKVVTLFLLLMVLIGMVGKLLFPGAGPRLTRRKGRFCPDCGRPLIGRSCDCKGKA